MVIDPHRFYSPKEIITVNGGILPISLSAVYAAIARGEIPCKAIGTRKFIPGSFLEAYLGSM